MEPAPRRRRATPSPDAAHDSLVLRIFTLADHAVVPPDGKLYMNGGGVDRMGLQQVPGGLGPLTLAIRVRVPWRMTSDTLPLLVRILDADRNPVGPDPLVQANVEVGRPPGLRPGDEIGVNVVVQLTGYPVQTEGTFYFHVTVADQVLGVLPLKIIKLAPGQPLPPPM